MFRQLRLSSAIGAALILMAFQPAAAAAEKNLTAQRLLSEDNPQAAIQVLMPAYVNGEIDNQSLFLLGISHKSLQRYKEAAKYLSELLERDPEATRVKLELAEVHYRLGQMSRAKQLLHEAKSSNPPARVGENIDAFLAFIESGTPRMWSAYASVGLLHDTNVNQGPRIDTVLMYDLPFTLNKDAKGNTDWASVWKAGVNFNRAIDDSLAFQAGLNLHYSDYQKLNRFDALSLSLSAGPSWRVNSWSFSLPYVFSVVKIGHDDDWYSTSNGLAPQFGYQVSQQLFVQGSLAWQEKRYKGNSPRNGDSLTFSPSVRYSIDNRSYVNVGGYIGKEDSGIITSRNDSHGVSVGYYRAFNKKWSLYASPAWSVTDYKGIEAAYGKSREDERLDFTANINYFVESWNTNLTLSYTYTDNRSSIKMYRYKREQALFSFSKNF